MLFCIYFSALFGATFAFLLLLAQKFNLLDDNNHNNLFSPRVSFFAAVLALLGLIATSVYAVICPNKDEFVEIQSYISIVPVCILIFSLLAFVSTRKYVFMIFISDRMFYFATKCFWYFTNQILDDVCFLWKNFLGAVCVSFSYLVVSRFEWDACISSYLSCGECVNCFLHICMHLSRGNDFTQHFGTREPEVSMYKFTVFKILLSFQNQL